MTRALLIALAILTALCSVAAWQLKVAYQTIGEQKLAIGQATRTAEDNRLVFEASMRAKDAEIEGLTRARQLSEQAAQASLKNEAAARSRAETLERRIREAAVHDDESIGWAARRVPDALIDGMRDAAAAARADH